jgi:hypothetical protein
MTDCDKFLVVQSQDGWQIRFKGSNLGSFESRSEALRGAISVADRSGKSGAPAQVLAEDDAGMTHPIWVFGRDGCSLER